MNPRRYTALAPIPLSTFAGEPTQNVGKSFFKSYCAVCLEGSVIVLVCLAFNMLVLVGTVKISDRIIREMMGL